MNQNLVRPQAQCRASQMTLVVKNLPANTGNTGWIPRSGRSPEAGNGNPFQYYCLENSMDRGTFQLQSRGVTKSQTWLRDWAHISTMQHEASQFRNIQTPYLSNLRWTMAQILRLPCCVWFHMTSENYLWHPTPRNDSIFHLLSCQCFVYQQLSDGCYNECFHSKCYKAKYNQCSWWSRQHAWCLQRDWKWAFLVCIRKLPWNSISKAYRLTRTCVCQLRRNLSLVDAEMPATWLQGTSVVSQNNCHLALSEGLCITDLRKWTFDCLGRGGGAGTG